MSNFRPDTRGAVVSLFSGSLVQLCCGERGTLRANFPGMCSQWFRHTAFARAHGVGAFPVYTAQAPGCSAGLHALPRSKPLRFRFSGAPQRRRLGWACVLCPSQVRAAQVTRCLVGAVAPVGGCDLSPPPSQPPGFLGVQWHAFSGGPCVSSGELISGCDPPGGCWLSRIPRSLG